MDTLNITPKQLADIAANNMAMAELFGIAIIWPEQAKHWLTSALDALGLDVWDGIIGPTVDLGPGGIWTIDVIPLCEELGIPLDC